MSRGPHQLITPAGGKREEEEEEERHIVVMFFIFSACSEEFIESSRFNKTLLPSISKCLLYILKYRMSFNILTYRNVTMTAQHFLIRKHLLTKIYIIKIIYFYKVLLCVVMSVCSLDLEIGVLNMLQNHTNLLGMMKIELFWYYLQ